MEHSPDQGRGAIKGLFISLYRACVLPKSKDEDSARKEYILNVILVSSIFMLFILDGLVLYHTLLHGQHYLGVSFRLFSVLLLFFILLYAISRRGYFIVSSYLLIAALFFSNSYATVIWNVNLPIAILAYAFIISIAGILIGTAFGFAMTVLTAGTIAGIWHLHIHGFIISQRQDPTEDDVIAFVTFYFLIMAVSWLSNREIEKSLTRARRSEIALKEERDLLEVRVIERTDELRKAQFEELEQEHRFAEFGRSASGLFHDLLNVLNAISLRTEGNAAEETSLATAYSTTRRIQQFMRGIQKQLDEKNICESFSLIEGVEQAVQLIAHKAAKENVRIVFLYDKEKPFMYWGIPFKFHQIVMNLIGNAIDAYRLIPKTEASLRTVTVRIGTKNEYFVLTVEDHGCGIPHALQEKIFKPFFTTKSEARGSGIGLASIKKIIEEDFRGTIDVKSEEHAGALFTVTFPILMPSQPIEPPLNHHEHPLQNHPSQEKNS
jgi:signal transduction histidine kinase